MKASLAYCSTNYKFNTWCVWQCVWWVTWYLSSSCCSEHQCTHIQLSPFYHPSTLYVMQVIKIPGPPYSSCNQKWHWPGKARIYRGLIGVVSYQFFGVHCPSTSHTDQLQNPFCRYIFPVAIWQGTLSTTSIVYPLLVTVTFWVMETVVSFNRREDWAEPLQVYCPPCEVCRGENVMVWIVDWSVFVVVSRVVPSVEVTGWPLESIHWAVDELVRPLRILVMLQLREYCCPAIGIPSTLMLGINSGSRGKAYQLSVNVMI